jgi:transposase
MAGKPKHMSQIKQLLRLHKEGESKKSIARILGISKNTVKTYLAKLVFSRYSIEELLALDDNTLEAKFHAGNPAYKDPRYEHLKTYLDYYASELNRTGVTRQLLWEEYIASYPQGYSRSQFCYHLSQHLTASKPSMVLNHQPGDKLYIDFAGKTLSYTDPQTGEAIVCQVFVACLPYSDYAFAMVVPTQNITDFIYALTCCLKDIGGVPKALVPDNLKSAIVKASRYEPNVNQALDDLANHYDTTVVPARVRKPKDKALVENQVRLVYQRVYAKIRNMQFFSLASLNQEIQQRIQDHNQTRMQEKPYCREEQFLAKEKHHLNPLPSVPYEIKYYHRLKVAPNNHICLKTKTRHNHYYSVPYTYIGQKVNVVYTRSMVYIYAQNKRIAVHPRSHVPGKYTTDKAHLCSTHQYYLERSPDYYINKAQSRDELLGQLFRLIFSQDRHPEQLYRSCDGLLSLQRKTDPGEFARACEIAIENEVYTYLFIKNVINNKMTLAQEEPKETDYPDHKNIRGESLL